MAHDDNLPISLEDLDQAPSVLPSARAPVEFEKYHALVESFTFVSDEKIRLMEENASLRSSINTASILDTLIEPYAKNAFRFMCAYSTFVALAISINGFHLGGFSVEASVLQVLVGSTAVTVIGLVGMVLTGIFVGARRALDRR